MNIVKNIRVLKGAAVLAERNAGTPSLDLKRFNLFYGFNGSGKSTLSRIFAALQSGKKLDRLPEDCTFEIELSDGSKLSYPNSLAGLEKRICVFNSDFVTENLRWEPGAANPVFYIGADQAEAAHQLKTLEATLPGEQKKHEGEIKVLNEREKAFNEYKRNLARTVSERLRQASRYEASQLLADMEKLNSTAGDKLSDAALDAATATCARSEPPAKVNSIEIATASVLDVIKTASKLVPKSIGSIVLESLESHPEMVIWVKKGHEYHAQHGLKSCLYCGGAVTDERKELLSAAFDSKVSDFISELDRVAEQASACMEALVGAKAAIPAAAQLSGEFQPPFKAAAARLTSALDNISPLLEPLLKALQKRKVTPTNPVTVPLVSEEAVVSRIEELEESCNAVNEICKQHADMVDDFNEHQRKAREAIRRHFVASSVGDFKKHEAEISEVKASEKVIKDAVEEIKKNIVLLRAKVQQHGLAAEKINALVKSYLGHGELTVVAVADGYELHRHGALIRGAPSEGEKTAIALCYFLTTLEAEDRKFKDLIIVIDDPISSLDTRAMNYACGLIRNRLSDASQLIVLTHNQQCMNEFKKAWKRWAEPDVSKASLKFIDVSIPASTMTRSANIIELPKHLREYESEYHYLFQKVMAFEVAGASHFEYAFMMPNVLRRVLEVFLAFKVPRSGNLNDKLKTLCERHDKLDQERLNALERLSQVESHSDSLDDLIMQSSMTVEESRDANSALLHLMEVVDSAHLIDLRKYCRL